MERTDLRYPNGVSPGMIYSAKMEKARSENEDEIDELQREYSELIERKEQIGITLKALEMVREMLKGL